MLAPQTAAIVGISSTMVFIFSALAVVAPAIVFALLPRTAVALTAWTLLLFLLLATAFLHLRRRDDFVTRYLETIHHVAVLVLFDNVFPGSDNRAAVIQQNGRRTALLVEGNDLALALQGHHPASLSRGQHLLGLLMAILAITVIFIFEAAHQAAANSRNLSGIQGEILLLRHTDGNRFKIPQEGGAAKGPPTAANPPHEFCLIANANLAKFDTGTEY